MAACDVDQGAAVLDLVAVDHVRFELVDQLRELPGPLGE